MLILRWIWYVLLKEFESEYQWDIIIIVLFKFNAQIFISTAKVATYFSRIFLAL